MDPQSRPFIDDVIARVEGLMNHMRSNGEADFIFEELASRVRIFSEFTWNFPSSSRCSSAGLCPVGQICQAHSTPREFLYYNLEIIINK